MIIHEQYSCGRCRAYSYLPIESLPRVCDNCGGEYTLERVFEDRINIMNHDIVPSPLVMLKVLLSEMKLTDLNQDNLDKITLIEKVIARAEGDA